MRQRILPDTYWMIVQWTTALWLPSMEGRGQTYVEPCNHLPPRLFTSERAAKCALTWWLRGHSFNVGFRSYDSFGDMDDDVTLMTERVHGRSRETMIVLPAHIHYGHR